VNTFRNPKGDARSEIELARSTEEEKQSQLKRLPTSSSACRRRERTRCSNVFA
jgi:hypothetical protein